MFQGSKAGDAIEGVIGEIKLLRRRDMELTMRQPLPADPDCLFRDVDARDIQAASMCREEPVARTARDIEDFFSAAQIKAFCQQPQVPGFPVRCVHVGVFVIHVVVEIGDLFVRGLMVSMVWLQDQALVGLACSA